VEVSRQLWRNPALLLLLATILLGGASARFYAYREPGALPTALLHLALATVVYLIILRTAYQRLKTGETAKNLVELLVIFSTQLGLGAFLGIYRLGIIDIGLLGELAATGLHFLLALVTLLLLASMKT